MEYPKNLRYHPEHLWVRSEGDEAVLGITDFAQEQLGEIVYIKLPEIGDEVLESRSLGEIESTKIVSDLIAPVSGRVIAVNDSALFSPELVNSAPYTEGWLVKVQLSEPLDMSARLLDAESYSRSVGHQAG